MYTDTQRLDWLIKTGNYGYLDTKFWPDDGAEIRLRIDEAMKKEITAQPQDSADTDPGGCKLFKCNELINGVCYHDGECKHR